ncbi:accessory factor UbiK family protein [Psychrobium sp. MM17-31]|uniref:ubiquinone biosynthesis accessory factor UbiK n=1 Tax=Psychrobium sp. MM17-31 TaxID=2917758 RepID=UPI001EF4C0FF|nr:accessory factor UbiK family protein [Psychrobium sp. MM17-31]MCG7533102.1 accessory factor UbiK family protein [Psychrobium sp. MM17-31]
MINGKKLEEIAQQVANALPPGLKSVADEVENKTKQVLQGQLNKLDVVTREEFDVQTQVLLKTREKLVALEQQVAELSALLNDKQSDGKSE